MATIKSFTDLTQSKVLAEFLPIESADMCFANDGTAIKIDANPYTVRYSMWKDCVAEIIPCWSLAALLTVIPYAIHKSDNEFYRLEIDKGHNYYDIWYSNNSLTVNDLDVTSDNFVDACVKMILKLHEQKLL